VLLLRLGIVIRDRLEAKLFRAFGSVQIGAQLVFAAANLDQLRFKPGPIPHAACFVGM
jgi:hypothetical protein